MGRRYLTVNKKIANMTLGNYSYFGMLFGLAESIKLKRPLKSNIDENIKVREWSISLEIYHKSWAVSVSLVCAQKIPGGYMFFKRGFLLPYLPSYLI